MDENIKLLGLIEKNRKAAADSDAELSSQLAAIALYQKNGYGFNIDNGLRVWRQRQGNALKRIIAFGDSITVGTGASNESTDAYPVIMRAKLQSLLGNAGAGFVMMDNPGWAFTGTWGVSSGYGPCGINKNATTPGCTATITLSGDNFDIYVGTYSTSGSFTVQIDSGEPQTINPGTTVGGNVKTNISAGSNGSHVITINSPGTGILILLGVSANIGSSGVRLHKTAKGGVTMSAASLSLGWITPMAPDLSIIAFATNDYLTQNSLANFRSAATTIIQKCLLYGSVLLVSPIPDQNQANAIKQKDYAAELIALAKTYGCALVSMYDRWGAYTSSLMYNGTHPNTLGYYDQAQALLRHVIEV